MAGLSGKKMEKYHPNSRVGIETEELFFEQQHQKQGRIIIF